LDMMNFLASANYYAEAIAGSVVGSPTSNGAFAGSVAMLISNNEVVAEVGDGAVITLGSGNFDMDAESGAVARLIGGAVAATTGSTGVGVNIAALIDEDVVRASVGANASIGASGDITVDAKATSDTWAATIAAAVSTGTGPSIGGNLNVIVSGNKVWAGALGADGATAGGEQLTAGGDIRIAAENESKLTLIAASVGAGSGVAVGGTVGVIVTNNDTRAAVGNGAALVAGKGAVISAKSAETMLNILASLSGSSANVAAAGTLGVLVSQSLTEASVGANAEVTANNGSILVSAEGNVKQVVVMGAVSGSMGGAAVGGTVNVGVFDHQVTAKVGEHAQLRALKPSNGANVVVSAKAHSEVLLITIAGAASAASGAVAGAIPVVVSSCRVLSEVGPHAKIEAGDTIAVVSRADNELYNAAGSVAVSAGVAGVGATLSTLVVANSVEAKVHDYVEMIARAMLTDAVIPAGVELPGGGTRFRGVLVSATAKARLAMFSGSGAASAGAAAVAGVVNTLVLKNRVKAAVGNHVVLVAGRESKSESSARTGDGSVLVESEDDSHIYNIAGALAASSGTGVGASIVAMVYDKDVSATVGDNGSILATMDVTVKAASKDEVILLALSFAGGGSVGVAVGASALVFENDVLARLGGRVLSAGSIKVSAYSETKMDNYAAAVGIGGTVGVTPIAIVTYFDGTTKAVVGAAADIDAIGAVTVRADSKEDIATEAAGVSASGVASVSGTVDVILSKQKTVAMTESGALIDAQALSVNAADDFKLTGVVVTAAASGTVGVAISALVTVLHNTTSAIVGSNNRIATVTGGVEVGADSNRDIGCYAGTVAVGQVGVGGTLMVVVAGGKMKQDAADELSAGFSPEDFLAATFEKAHGSASEYGMDGAGEMLEGDGDHQSETEVGGGIDGYHDDDVTGEVDLESGEDADNSGAAAPGADSEFGVGEGGDLDDASGLGSAKPVYAPLDATTAIIGANTAVTSAGAIFVTANDRLLADLFTGTIAGGAYAAVGAGIAVAVLYSNVEAKVEDGAQLSAVGEIRIAAAAGSTPVADADTDRTGTLEDSFSKSTDNPIDLSKRSIRAISITGGGAIVGVSVALASINVFSTVAAALEGDVTKASLLSVSATC
ncbi:MAG: hypothetical protein GX592_05355, partial [Clostridiales bacterium]|nr:hypothetical protein [Clostridiales bacterium]